MNILFACSECYPLIKTGGLADVAYNLSLALHQLGHDIRVVLPAYAQVKAVVGPVQHVGSLSALGYSVSLLKTCLLDTPVPLYLVDCPVLFDRPGGPYVDSSYCDWPDNGLRFGLFCHIVAALALDRAGQHWQPEIFHGNDWQTGLAVALTASEVNPPTTVFTIHNLAYQGLYDRALFEQLQLSPELWDFRALEFHGQLSFIKGGIVFANAVNTVSPTYAREVLTPEFGCGLDGLLRYRGEHFCGILNGIDTTLWNPATDHFITRHYTADNLQEKQRNKSALLQRFNMSADDGHLLIGMVSRLSEQKGIDLILAAAPQLVNLPIKLLLLGSGDKDYEAALTGLAARYPKAIGILTEHDEALAHRMIAGADALLIPSRYEPCGLTQLYSQRYGTVPVARAVGGLVDTIINASHNASAHDGATGVLFGKYSPQALVDAVQRTLDIFANHRDWRALQLNGMQRDFSWRATATKYVQLYRQERGSGRVAGGLSHTYADSCMSL